MSDELPDGLTAELMDRALRDTLPLVRERIGAWLEETLREIDPELERVTREVDPAGFIQPVLRLQVGLQLTELGARSLSGELPALMPDGPRGDATAAQRAALDRQLADGEAQEAG